MNTVVFILSEAQSGSAWSSYVLGSHSDTVHLGSILQTIYNGKPYGMQIVSSKK